jgi:ATP-dependent RNA circularization protein (DNA/RNA ligase family)
MKIYKTITVRFDSEESLRKFAEKVDQLNISTKTKKIQYPKTDKSQGSLFE